MVASISMVGSKTAPELIRWSPADGGATGLKVFTDGVEEPFIPWTDLKAELDHQLMPQLFADPAQGWTFALRDQGHKPDWLMYVVDAKGERYCDVWLGNDPDNGWGWDGLVRVGDSESEPHVWQVYQRYSDGTYRRLPSLCRDLDEMKRLVR